MAMDLKQIERLMAVMGRTGMKRIVLKQEGFEVELERECANISPPVFTTHPTPTPLMMGGASSLPPMAEERKASGAGSEGASDRFVTSPMVGTFYMTPSPDDPPFVRVGEEIDENSVVCIIEAMKVMNEVKAGVRGKIVEILLKNGDPVEFGTKIFRIV